MFDTVTQFNPGEQEYIGFVPIKGEMLCHKADVDSRKTKCGLDIGIYPEGWIWGGEVNCEECNDG